MNQQKLLTWSQQYLPAHISPPQSPGLAPVSGDAGFRSYYRLNSQPTVIAVDAPPEHEDVPGFVEKALFLDRAGIHVPHIHAVDFQAGYMLLEDLGDQLLLGSLNENSVASHYDSAESVLLALQQLPPDTAFDDYSRAKLLQEMSLFPEWFVMQLLGLEMSPGQQEVITSAFELLASNALEQPQVLVHRDFHARNLMLQPDSSLGVIDFQDAVVGPITYDLVSLLRDCYIRWPREMVEQRVAAFYQRSVAQGSLPEVGEARFMRWFNLMGLQRHLKVLGIFARLWLRDGKPGYLSDLPLVMRYVLEQTAIFPELSQLHSWLLESIVPIARGHEWYRDWQTAGEHL